MDMRNYKTNEKADLVVSELLGGFADNELAPECLDGALHLMKESCVCVPKWYRSCLSPIQSVRLLTNGIRSAVKDSLEKQVEFADNQNFGLVESWNQVWVSRMYHRYDIDQRAMPAEVFRFNHPKFEGNEKYGFKQLRFKAKVSCELMGFAGFMDCCLEGEEPNGTFLSTIPAWHTATMYSWYPTFFPLVEPVKVKVDDEIVLNFWRLRDTEKVWYEWNLEKPVVLPIQNSGGCGYFMPLK